ncbi:MAG TPA: glycerol kinase GlpK [Chthoniobacteraceae bacterium]|jgi:glycerol kinase|nr:glycerol kinase GlpK [Chthoniobacteraceae bacterium]
MKYVLALDQGTTSSRAILFDAEGQPRAVAQREFEQIFPQPGWVEHRPEDIWSTQSAVAAEALARAGIHARDVAALGITNQRETTLLWDRKTGKPVCNAIVWQDRRTAPLCKRLRADGAEELIRSRTGLVIDPYFSGTKLRWMLDHVEGARVRAERGELAFGTVDAWLIWNLTEGALHLTDFTNASRTLMFDIHRGCWDEELLALLDVPRAVLPEVVASSGVCGAVGANSFGAGIPIAGIAGDQQAALFGQACFQPGMAKNTYGTGCFMLMTTGAEARASRNQLLTTIAWQMDGRLEYALEGSVFIAGAAVQWLRDGLGIIRSSAEIEPLAATVRDNGGVYFVPAFSGLGSPHWDPYARGAVLGITRGTTAGHLARATLESIAFQSADLLHAMEQDSAQPLRELRVDGGAAVNDFLMQFQADLLRAPVVRPRTVETTALGAACLAGLAAGFWRSREEIAARWAVDRRFEPARPAAGMEAMQGQWRRAVERAKGWASEP